MMDNAVVKRINGFREIAAEAKKAADNRNTKETFRILKKTNQTRKSAGTATTKSSWRTYDYRRTSNEGMDF